MFGIGKNISTKKTKNNKGKNELILFSIKYMSLRSGSTLLGCRVSDLSKPPK